MIVKLAWTVGTASSCVINWMTGGRIREPLCARIGRNALIHDGKWAKAQKLFDLTFFLDREHCFKSYLRYATK